MADTSRDDKRVATSVYMESRELWYAVTLTTLRTAIDKATRRGEPSEAARALLREFEECRAQEIPGESADETRESIRQYLAAGGIA